MSEEPNVHVVRQRIRNRIVEYLELASSFEAQLDYQPAVHVPVPNEVINQGCRLGVRNEPQPVQTTNWIKNTIVYGDARVLSQHARGADQRWPDHSD